MAEFFALASSATALLLVARRMPTERGRRIAMVVGALAVVATAVGLLMRR